MTGFPDLEPRLRAGLGALALDPAPLSGPLLSYLALLARWNRAYNLTAIRDPEQMLDKHLLDSLAIWREVAAVPHAGTLRLADIGTGPGLPGIPLALALPQLEVALIESVGKKARFLREAVRELELAGRVRVLARRAQAVAEPGRHDCLVARAFGTLAAILAAGGHLLRPGGRLLALKGQRPDAELAALPGGWALLSVRTVAVPGLDAERHLVEIEKTPEARHGP
ncbi:MAG TPA: 16S rRNA (guanine(527)-N(7))-methyltransferase RsmG [Xanthomonadaceae bacterium]|nr:16S rRNA (guanine(527)-N(7))-methyltransferase RsmG [Xanthomonadaceae bacterium]